MLIFMMRNRVGRHADMHSLGGDAQVRSGVPRLSHWARIAGPVQCRGNRPWLSPISKANEEAHWQKTTRLMFIHLGVWFFFGYVIHMFVVPLNKIIISGSRLPLGFYMAAQGSLIVFVVMLFMFARQQNRIDREHGYAEEEE